MACYIPLRLFSGRGAAMLIRLLVCAALALLPSSLALSQPTSSGLAPSAAGKSLSVSSSSSCVAMTQQNNSIVVWNVGAVAAYYNVNGATATTGNPQLPAGGVITLSIAPAASFCAITASSTTILQITQGFGLATVGWAGITGAGGGTAVTIADGADVAEGATADAAATAGSTGTVSAKLRLMTTQLGTLNTSLGTINTTLGSPFQAGGALGAGSNIIGNVRIDQTTDGTTNGVRSTNQYPAGATPITASATGTTGATTATLATGGSITTYLCGFSIRANATAAVTGNATVTGTITGTLNFTQWTAPNASGLGITEMIFTPCVPASAVNTAIAVVSAAPGTGGVVSSTAWGYTK